MSVSAAFQRKSDAESSLGASLFLSGEVVLLFLCIWKFVFHGMPHFVGSCSVGEFLCLGVFFLLWGFAWFHSVWFRTESPAQEGT